MAENDPSKRHDENIARKKAALEKLEAEKNWFNRGGAPIGWSALVVIGVVSFVIETLTGSRWEHSSLLSWPIATLAAWAIFSSGYLLGLDLVDKRNLEETEDGDKPIETRSRRWLSYGGLGLFLLHVAYNPEFYFF